MNDSFESRESLALIATFRTFLRETLHPATAPADVLLLTTVRTSIAAELREERSNVVWYKRWLPPLIEWFIFWRIVTYLRSHYPDPTAALAAFQAWEQMEIPPPDQTVPLNPELLALLRCPKDQQPLEQWTDEQGAIWVVNPRLGYQYPVVDGIPMLLETEIKQLDAAYRAAAHR